MYSTTTQPAYYHYRYYNDIITVFPIITKHVQLRIRYTIIINSCTKMKEKNFKNVSVEHFQCCGKFQ